MYRKYGVNGRLGALGSWARFFFFLPSAVSSLTPSLAMRCVIRPASPSGLAEKAALVSNSTPDPGARPRTVFVWAMYARERSCTAD